MFRKKKKSKVKYILLGLGGIALLWLLWPATFINPVEGAHRSDWNQKSFWAEPWGASGVHKGIDIFARKGTPVLAPAGGVVLWQGEIRLGGNVVVFLGPRGLIHYLAHLEKIHVATGALVGQGSQLGTVGDSGNAKGKPPHLHYSVWSLVPRPWKMDSSTKGWLKAVILDPGEVIEGS